MPVLVAAHTRHHLADALGERRVHRVRADLVVLDEIDAGIAQLADELAGGGGGEADVRLDDGAQQRAVGDPGRATRAGDAVRWPREHRAVIGGERERQQPHPGRLAEIVEIAGDGSREGGEVRADVVDGERYRHAGTAPRTRRTLPLEPRTGETRCRDRFERFDLVDRRACACVQLGGLTLHLDECAAGLLPRKHLGRALGGERRLEQVDRGEPAGHSVLKSGNGRTGSFPFQPSDASRIRRKSLPFGPATSESSITLPGWNSVSKYA